MKGIKIILGILLLIICSISVNAATSAWAGNVMKITILRTNPTPVEPGKYFDIYLQAENMFDDDLKDVQISFKNNYPFSLYQEEERVKDFGFIQDGQRITFSYRIRVADEAVEGDNELKFIVSSNRGDFETAGLKISLQNVYANLNVDKVIITPSRIAPGNVGNVEIVFKNGATSLLQDIEVRLDINSSTPFAPIGTSAEQKISYIEPGEAKSVSFDLMAEPDAINDLYRIPLKVKYHDKLGKNYTVDDFIGLIIGGNPEINAEVESTNIYTRTGAGDISIKFINKGLTDLKFLDVTLLDSKDYDIITNEKVYLGNVDSDDYETADYRIKLRKFWKSKINLLFSISYRDSTNKLYVDEMNVPFKIVSEKELGIAKSGYGFELFLIILIAAYFIGYRMWKKENKKNGLKLYTKVLLEKGKYYFSKIRKKFKK